MKTSKKIITTTTLYDIPTTPKNIQLGLDMNPIIKVNEEYKLSENQKKMFSIFYYNSVCAYSQVQIKKMAEIDGINCAGRFIKRASINGWIRQIRIIPGTTINNLLLFYKEPDMLENGQKVKDGRSKYFQITELGKKIFEVNEKFNKK